MNTVVKLDPVAHPETDVCFKLSFQKARERTPDNRADFETVQIQLVADEWQQGGGKKSGGKLERVALIEATLAAKGIIGDDAAIGHVALAKLLIDETTGAATWRVRLAAAAQTKPYQHLLVTKDGVKFWRLAR